MIELVKNTQVFFDDITHTYTTEDLKRLLGVTGLMKKHGLSADYSGIPDAILQKAADRGTTIHQDIDHFNKTGNILSDEVRAFAELNLSVLESEYLVSDNKTVASSIDIVLCDCSLADLKTTSQLHYGPLSWQLSIYAYLFELQNPGLTVPSLYAIHIKGGKAMKVGVDRLPKEDIERLFECEASGRRFTNDTELTAIDHQAISYISAITEIIQKIKTLEQQKKEYERNIEDLFNTLGVNRWETERFIISKGSDYTRNTLDVKALEADQTEIYKKYMKQVVVSGAIKTKLK